VFTCLNSQLSHILTNISKQHIFNYLSKDKHLQQTGCTGIIEPTRGLATLPQGGSRSLQWSDRDGSLEDRKRTLWQSLLLCVAGMHCWETSLE